MDIDAVCVNSYYDKAVCSSCRRVVDNQAACRDCAGRKGIAQRPKKHDFIMPPGVALGGILTVLSMAGTLYMFFNPGLKLFSVYALLFAAAFLVPVVFGHHLIRQRKARQLYMYE